MPVAFDAGRDQGVHADHPATPTNFQYQRVGGDERVRTGGWRAGPELLDLFARSVAITLTCDFDSPVMPRLCTSLSIRRVDTPSR